VRHAGELPGDRPKPLEKLQQRQKFTRWVATMCTALVLKYYTLSDLNTVPSFSHRLITIDCLPFNKRSCLQTLAQYKVVTYGRKMLTKECRTVNSLLKYQRLRAGQPLAAKPKTRLTKRKQLYVKGLKKFILSDYRMITACLIRHRKGAMWNFSRKGK
jgi:hypothetical protein